MRKSASRRAAVRLVILGVGLWLVLGGPSAALAMDWSGICNAFSPFCVIPDVWGEVRFRPLYATLTEGRQTVPDAGISWDLRRDFGLVNSSIFLDLMGRVQVGRLSVRTNINLRDFQGSTRFRNIPNQYLSDARFEYSGWRVGCDLDIAQWRGSRLGINADTDLYSPIFQEAVQTNQGGKKMVGNGATTLGFHTVINPPARWRGMSIMLEGRARWSIAGADVTDWETSLGLMGSETFLGALAIKGGFRRTVIQFHDFLPVNGIDRLNNFQAAMEGWFGEMALYY